MFLIWWFAYGKNRFVPNVKYFPFISADINIMNVSSVRLSRNVDKEFAYSDKFGIFFNFEVASLQKKTFAKIMFNKLSTMLRFP